MLKRYGQLCDEFTKTVTNNWGGYWTATALGKTGMRNTPSRKSSLIGSYSILDTDAKTSLNKPKEEEARHLMAAYFQAHKAELPADVRKLREPIVELIMEGLSPAEAFSKALGFTV